MTGRVPVTIIMHGFMGNKNERMLALLADSLAARGIASVRFDFNGHGQSEGKFEEMTVPNEIEDAKKIYAYVASQPWADTTRIALAGHSQGGVVSAMTAGEPRAWPRGRRGPAGTCRRAARRCHPRQHHGVDVQPP